METMATRAKSNTSTTALAPALLEALAKWETAKTALDTAKVREAELRQEVFGLAFPKAKEGTNTLALFSGWALKGVRTINRTIDVAALPAVLVELREEGVVADALVDYKPSLNLAQYRALPTDKRKVFEQALTIKDGTPSLKIVPPKAKE